MKNKFKFVKEHNIQLEMKGSKKKMRKQAGAELCQAQMKLGAS